MIKCIGKIRGDKNHPISNFNFDGEYEKVRKFQLEKYLMRSKDKNEEEKKIIEELRKLENVTFFPIANKV